MSNLLTAIVFVLMLSSIIMIHEFGHYIFAKLFNVYVYEFSLGMGPKLIQWKGKETKYSIRAFPIGGYCAMAGEDENANVQTIDNYEVPKERTLDNLNWFKKIVIMFAGPCMNFLLALVLFISVYVSIGYRVINPPCIVNGVMDGSPAQEAGFKFGDEIIEVTYDDTTFKPKDFYDLVQETYYCETEMTYRVIRDNQEITIKVTPEYNEEEKRYLIGIIAPIAETEKLTFVEEIEAGFSYFKDASLLLVKTLAKLFRGIGLNNLSGPVGIYKETANELTYGFTNFLAYVGLISLNIGIMNLLPIPMFDGGRIVITIVETIVGHPLNKKVQSVLIIVSLLLVLFLFIFVTYNDIIGLL